MGTVSYEETVVGALDRAASGSHPSGLRSLIPTGRKHRRRSGDLTILELPEDLEPGLAECPLVVDRAGDYEGDRLDPGPDEPASRSGLDSPGQFLPHQEPQFLAAEPLCDHAAGDVGIGSVKIRDLKGGADGEDSTSYRTRSGKRYRDPRTGLGHTSARIDHERILRRSDSRRGLTRHDLMDTLAPDSH
jgi:hypothetical protein